MKEYFDLNIKRAKLEDMEASCASVYDRQVIKSDVQNAIKPHSLLLGVELLPPSLSDLTFDLYKHTYDLKYYLYQESSINNKTR